MSTSVIWSVSKKEMIEPYILHICDILKIKLKIIIFFVGSRPESSEDDHPQYQNGNPPLLLDPMAIHMMPPEYDRPVTHKKTTSMIEKVTNGLSKLHFTNGNIKGSLV